MALRTEKVRAAASVQLRDDGWHIGNEHSSELNSRIVTSKVTWEGKAWELPSAGTADVGNSSLLGVANVSTPTFYADLDVPEWVQLIAGKAVPVTLTVSWFDKNLSVKTSGRKLQGFTIDSKGILDTILDWTSETDINNDQAFITASIVGVVKKWVPQVRIVCAWDFPVNGNGDMWMIVECGWSTLDDLTTNGLPTPSMNIAVGESLKRSSLSDSFEYVA